MGYCMRQCPTYIVRSALVRQAMAVTTTTLGALRTLAFPCRPDGQNERADLPLASCAAGRNLGRVWDKQTEPITPTEEQFHLCHVCWLI